MLDRPVFIVGSARSGTTLMRACLERSRSLWRLGRASEYLFEPWFHPLRHGRRDHVLDASDATPELRSDITAAFERECYAPTRPLTDADRRAWLDRVAVQGLSPWYYDVAAEKLAAWFGARVPEGPPFDHETGEIPPFTFVEQGTRPDLATIAGGLRLLDKDPAHAYRIRFLETLFPDARFVFVVRNGLHVVSSLMEAWRHPRWFFTYRMPVPLQIAGYSDRFQWGERWWNLQLPPGWEAFTDQPLEAVCAHCWHSTNEAMLPEAERIVAGGAGVLVRYEELLARPVEVLERVAEVIEIPASELLDGTVLPTVATATPPSPSKWRRNEAAVLAVRDMIEPINKRLDYAA
jgi:hypothetical protein